MVIKILASNKKLCVLFCLSFSIFFLLENLPKPKLPRKLWRRWHLWIADDSVNVIDVKEENDGGHNNVDIDAVVNNNDNNNSGDVNIAKDETSVSLDKPQEHEEESSSVTINQWFIWKFKICICKISNYIHTKYWQMEILILVTFQRPYS